MAPLLGDYFKPSKTLMEVIIIAQPWGRWVALPKGKLRDKCHPAMSLLVVHVARSMPSMFSPGRTPFNCNACTARSTTHLAAPWTNDNGQRPRTTAYPNSRSFVSSMSSLPPPVRHVTNGSSCQCVLLTHLIFPSQRLLSPFRNDQVAHD